jgi:hypothetical protein
LARHFLATAILACVTTAAHAMSVIAPSFQELVGSATVVVRGVVTDVHAVTVETAQGTAIRTLVTFQVERVLKGTAGDTLTLTFLGGKVGKRTLAILGMPTFKVGDREIVFVGNNGQTICPVLAAGYGRYHVRHDAASNRDFVARDNNAPLVTTDQVAQSLEAGAAAAPADGLTPEAFEARIIAAAHGNLNPSQP